MYLCAHTCASLPTHVCLCAMVCQHSPQRNVSWVAKTWTENSCCQATHCKNTQPLTDRWFSAWERSIWNGCHYRIMRPVVKQVSPCICSFESLCVGGQPLYIHLSWSQFHCDSENYWIKDRGVHLCAYGYMLKNSDSGLNGMKLRLYIRGLKITKINLKIKV